MYYSVSMPLCVAVDPFWHLSSLFFTRFLLLLSLRTFSCYFLHAGFRITLFTHFPLLFSSRTFSCYFLHALSPITSSRSFSCYILPSVSVVAFRRVSQIAKATVSFVMCLSVCPHVTTALSLDGFSWNFIFEYFSKNCQENSSFIKNW